MTLKKQHVGIFFWHMFDICGLFVLWTESHWWVSVRVKSVWSHRNFNPILKEIIEWHVLQFVLQLWDAHQVWSVELAIQLGSFYISYGQAREDGYSQVSIKRTVLLNGLFY